MALTSSHVKWYWTGCRRFIVVRDLITYFISKYISMSHLNSVHQFSVIPGTLSSNWFMEIIRVFIVIIINNGVDLQHNLKNTAYGSVCRHFQRMKVKMSFRERSFRERSRTWRLMRHIENFEKDYRNSRAKFWS